jgi:hypothetical protein
VKRSKYGAQPTEVDGVRFASKREAARFQVLRLLEKAGEIKELELQPRFPIYVCRRQNGELHKVCDYVADFRYREGRDGVLVVEDSKGMRTPTYRLKAKMFTAQYGLEIRET